MRTKYTYANGATCHQCGKPFDSFPQAGFVTSTDKDNISSRAPWIVNGLNDRSGFSRKSLINHAVPLEIQFLNETVIRQIADDNKRMRMRQFPDDVRIRRHSRCPADFLFNRLGAAFQNGRIQTG